MRFESVPLGHSGERRTDPAAKESARITSPEDRDVTAFLAEIGGTEGLTPEENQLLGKFVTYFTLTASPRKENPNSLLQIKELERKLQSTSGEARVEKIREALLTFANERIGNFSRNIDTFASMVRVNAAAAERKDLAMEVAEVNNLCRRALNSQGVAIFTDVRSAVDFANIIQNMSPNLTTDLGNSIFGIGRNEV